MLTTSQLLAQIMKLSYFPQIKVVHTSKVFHGQLYVPLVNWLLMIGTVLVAAIYNNVRSHTLAYLRDAEFFSQTTSLGNAYGVCVMFVTFFDTCMVSLAAMFVWRIRPYWVFFPWLTIACLDGVYLSSSLTKVPDGAWFTLTLASALAAGFILWRFGKEQQWAAEAADRFPTAHFVKEGKSGKIELTQRYGGSTISTIKCFGIFFDKAGETTPIVFSQFALKLVAAPEVMVFFHLRPLEKPTVPAENRYVVSRLAIPNCYRVIVRHGYNDEVLTLDLASVIYDQVRNFVLHRGKARGPLNPVTGDASALPPATAAVTTAEASEDSNAPPGENAASNTEDEGGGEEKSVKEEINADASLGSELAKLDECYTHQVLYIIGKEQMRIKSSAGIVRKTLLRSFLWIRDNTRSKVQSLNVEVDKLVEVGFVK